MFVVGDATPKEDVWRAICLWITKPSAYYKNVGTSDAIFLNLTQPTHFLQAVNNFFSSSSLGKIGTCSEVKLLLTTHLESQGIFIAEDSNLFDQQGGTWLIVRFILPKNGAFQLSNVELIICNFDSGVVEFFQFNENHNFSLNYTIVLDGDKVLFEIKLNSPKQTRLKSLFFSKLEKWTKNGVQSPGTSSLCLVSQEQYLTLYNKLKKKYCESIKKIWQESTDPDKFIHEDVAIATYLILLWGPKPQTFVDLGCGNGLLVYILSAEGHRGHGVDVRSRKIWNSYPSTTSLKEETIIPSPSYTFPGVDWIIGNHSDELTPWIPIIALLSSEHTNFFLLPCCAYEFNGNKYRRSNTSKSLYMDYMDYVERLSCQCGFFVSRDRLKIPSTKRICFVSKGRSSSSKNVIDIVESILGTESSQTSTEERKEWVPNFKPRDSVEKVRNCTQLDANFLSMLLFKISRLFLVDSPAESSSWDEGTPLSIEAIAKSLPREDLLRLKNECGGLQTFLRNNHFVFRIFDGKVSFRKPEVKSERPKSWKMKACWFDSYHPQRCPLESDVCSYIHLNNR